MLDVIRRFGHIHRLAASAALRLAVRCSLLIHALCPHTVWA
ncbi:pilus assembly protein, partial [Burkholderia glumae]